MVSSYNKRKFKIFAIHQPNYLPWLGYFYKIAKSDIFVFLDIVQYPRGQSFAARNRIKTPNGSSFLTIPISIPHGFSGMVGYHQVKFANDKWKKKHLKTIEFCYKKSKFFTEIFSLLLTEIDRHQSLVDLNIGLIDAICDYLKIKTKCIRLSEILTDVRQKTELIIDIGKAVDGNIYLSGQGGGHDYNDEKLLTRNDIRLIYSDFKHPNYPQLWGAFESHLSIIDLLFNCGPDSSQILLKSTSPS
jgi:hypothetical protein